MKGAGVEWNGTGGGGSGSRSPEGKGNQELERGGKMIGWEGAIHSMT